MFFKYEITARILAAPVFQSGGASPLGLSSGSDLGPEAANETLCRGPLGGDDCQFKNSLYLSASCGCRSKPEFVLPAASKKEAAALWRANLA
eukprot:CAMPEP_0169388752 /NCGR_PEP_ID=MMETSP1017-20121227/46262_1 /TAXON_ID=342587 /ORGANISM="Karlodinium micrum, Strain CCMP2283" /LENGTH=91 /DNA_ID=CAMNT_0009490665 /DNA_START=165 /DNA_END=437 /DNA_ORIENTATION=+